MSPLLGATLVVVDPAEAAPTWLAAADVQNDEETTPAHDVAAVDGAGSATMVRVNRGADNTSSATHSVTVKATNSVGASPVKPVKLVELVTKP